MSKKQEAKIRYRNANLELLEDYISVHTPVLTKCFCGNEYYSRPSSVFKSRSISSCGCYFKSVAEKRRVIQIGDTFNKLTVVSFDKKRILQSGQQKLYWLCLCECGIIKSIDAGCLRNNKIVSCGCHSRKQAKTIKLLDILTKTQTNCIRLHV